MYSQPSTWLPFRNIYLGLVALDRSAGAHHRGRVLAAQAFDVEWSGLNNAALAFVAHSEGVTDGAMESGRR